jgi:hypothetical protein
MKLGSLAIGVGLLLAIGPAQAEKWVDTKLLNFIDVDSIKKGPDGLVYYRERGKDAKGAGLMGAYDCAKNIAYSPEAIALLDNWKTKGEPVKPGTVGAGLQQFVCSRVR